MKNGHTSATTDKNMNNVPQAPHYVPEKEPVPEDEIKHLDVDVANEAESVGNFSAEPVKTPTRKLSRAKATPRKIHSRTKSVSPHVQSRQKMHESRLAAAKSASDISKQEVIEENEIAETVEEKRTFPATEPPKRRSYSHSVSVPGTARSRLRTLQHWETKRILSHIEDRAA